jgi:hypothetical protein
MVFPAIAGSPGQFFSEKADDRENGGIFKKV